MDTNDNFYGKEHNLNCFYMHTNFGQKYPKTAIVNYGSLCLWKVSLKLQNNLCTATNSYHQYRSMPTRRRFFLTASLLAGCLTMIGLTAMWALPSRCNSDEMVCQVRFLYKTNEVWKSQNLKSKLIGYTIKTFKLFGLV